MSDGPGMESRDGPFGFDVAAGPEQRLIVLASTNLMDWVPLQTNLLGGPLEYLSDPSAKNFNRRFYQVRRAP